MPRVLTLFPLPVLAAAAGDSEKDTSSPLNRDELSLYTAPPPPQLKFESVQPEPGHIEETIATLRKSLQPYTAWCQNTYSKIQHGVQFGSNTYGYLKNPPKDFYPKAGVIGFTGILGLFLARGSRVKRLLYPVGLMAVSTSLYYPEQAAAIVKSTGDMVYAGAVQSYASFEKLYKSQDKTKKGTDAETKP